MRILLSTFSAEGHGSYGIITRELWRRLRDLNPKWVVHQHGWVHESVETVEWPITPTLKAMGKDGKMANRVDDAYGQITFEKMLNDFKPDVVWTLSDFYMSHYMGKFRNKYRFKLIKHCPVDGTPQPKFWRELARDCDLFVPVTQSGAKALGLDVPHIYHGVDINRFKPLPPGHSTKVRQSFPEDSVFLGFIGNSQPRKMNFALYPIVRFMNDGGWIVCRSCGHVTLPEFDTFQAKVVSFPKQCSTCHGTAVDSYPPVLTHLWVHTFDRKDVAWRPEKMMERWSVRDRLHFTKEMSPDHGIKDSEMPLIYNSLDAYLALSGGEGFCLPVLEAMASGCPVVYTDYSAMPEFATGWPVRPAAFVPDPENLIDRAVPDIGDAIKQVYTATVLRPPEVAEKVAAGVKVAREKFSWDIIARQWSDTINANFQANNSQCLGVCV